MFERNITNSWVAGVAAGLSDKYHVNVVWFRLLFLASFLFFGLGLVVYWWYWIDETANNNQVRMNF